MKLTPIRVRGKRKRPPRESAAANARQSDTTQNSTSATPHDASASYTYTECSSIKRLSMSPPPPPSKMPRTNKAKPVPFDRRFPFEILERIFLLSANLNLPKSSPRLGWLLSGRRTLIEMVICSFGPTWDLFIEGADGLDAASDKSQSTARFQTSILTYSWATADLLLDAEHLWVQRTKLRTHLRSVNCFDVDLALVASSKCVVNPSRLPDLLRLHPPSELDIKIEPDPEPASTSQPVVSVYPCFTFDQLVFMLKCHDTYDIDPSPNDMPLDLLERGRRHSPPLSIPGPAPSVQEIGYCLNRATSPFTDHVCERMHWHVQHPDVRIPEWLLLGGGPYSQTNVQNDQNARAHRDAVRRQLRVAFDTFYWAVQGGARLMHTDTWEVTLQGVQHLLAIDLQEDEEEKEEFAAAATHALAAQRAHDWGGAAGVRDDMVYLGYSLDSLVMGYLALLGSLGLFTRHWPAKVMEDFMHAVSERAVDDPAFCATRTFLYLQRAALHRWSLTQANSQLSRGRRYPV